MNDYYEPQYAPKRERVTWAVQRLILVNALVFVAQLAIDIPLGYQVSEAHRFAPPGGVASGLLAFQPHLFMSGLVWKAFTYQFLHGGLMHLFMNMLWLFFFGPQVERALGTREFFRFYLICGTVAVLATVLPWLAWGRQVSVTGASGAVMALLVAFAMINPERQFYLFPLPVPINARAMVIIVIVMNVFWGMGRNSTTSVATHFGGMAVGYLYMKTVPVFRRWQLEQRRRHSAREESVDPAGDMVDNVFKFENHKRRH